MVKGVLIVLLKYIKGRFLGISIIFDKGCELKGKKGFVFVVVIELGIVKIEEKMYVIV